MIILITSLAVLITSFVGAFSGYMVAAMFQKRRGR